MRFLVYVGSPRSKGNTYKLAKEFKLMLELAGHTFDFVYAPDTVNCCKHCGACDKYGYCSIQDDWQQYSRDFHLYDALVIMSPIYFFGFSAQTKAFIDRMGGNFAEWKDKLISIITVSGSDGYLGGHDLLVESIKRTCQYNNSVYVGSYNKVTNDQIIPVTFVDVAEMTSLIVRTEIKQETLNEREAES